MGDVVELIAADLFELFAAGLELFVDLDGLFGHHRVRFLRAADQGKVRPGRQPFVAVGIQPDAEHDCLAFFLLGRVRHELKLRAAHHPVKSWRLDSGEILIIAEFSSTLRAFHGGVLAS